MNEKGNSGMHVWEMIWDSRKGGEIRRRDLSVISYIARMCASCVTELVAHYVRFSHYVVFFSCALVPWLLLLFVKP